MALIRKASAKWEGNLKDGKGHVKFGSFEGAYSFASRFENGRGSNPEEMIAAAHASCFSMAFSHGLAEAGFTPKSVSTTANVTLDKTSAGFKITQIELVTEAIVPGIDTAKFMEQAEGAKKGCPISQALAAVDIILSAKLTN
jgi:osmotically inducible protein OsmC